MTALLVGLAAGCAALAGWLVTTPRAAVRLRTVLAGHDPSAQRQPWAATLTRIRSAVGELHRRRRQAADWRAAVIALCDGLAAELTAGRAPTAAFTTASTTLDPALAAALRQHPGETMPEALERAAAAPGAEGLRLLAACWRVGVDRGGTFAVVVDNLAATLRDQEAHRQEITAQLAGPRASARLLAGLPLLGLGMAAALGADPLHFLLGTLPGVACLITGVGLEVLGLWWTGRIAAAAGVS